MDNQRERVTAFLQHPTEVGGARALMILGEVPPPELKALLESAPLEGVDLTRIRDLGRDVEL